MIKILFSDDNKLLFEDFKDRAYKLGIDLHCVTNWEDASIILDQQWDDFSGLILDGKGQLNDSSTSSDAKHVTSAIGWLKEQRLLGRIIPTVVYTAFLDKDAGNIDDFLRRDDDILLGMFSKDVPVENIFKKLHSAFNSLPETRLKHQYSDIFKLFDDKRLSKSMEPTILEILNGLSRVPVDKTDYNKIRDIIEEMLKMANSIDKKIVPDVLLNQVQNNRPNLAYSEFYLSGRDVKNGNSILIPKVNAIMTDHISRLYSSVVNCCQIFSHNTSQKHYPYAYKATVYGLLEVLLWYKDYLTKNYGI